VGTLTIGRWVKSFTLDAAVRMTFGADSIHQHRTYDGAALHALHLPSTIRVTSGVDHHDPVLTALSVTPDSVDTTAAFQQVTVTATVTDTESGVASGYFDLRPHPNASDHPIGETFAYFTVNGDTLTGTATIARCVITGDWELGLDIRDAAGRETHPDSAELERLGFPSTLSVTSDPPGHRGGPREHAASTSLTDRTITVGFNRPVKNATMDNLLVYRAKHFAQPVPTSAISCSDGTTTVPCDGSSGLATAVTLTVPSLGDHHYLVSPNQDSVVSQITDDAGNPVPWWR
jgi:hypothetical protein